MKVDDIVEHEDGSATLQFTLDSEEAKLLLELALTMLITSTAIENKRLTILEKAIEKLDITD
jgi:hypothetical protein